MGGVKIVARSIWTFASRHSMLARPRMAIGRIRVKQVPFFRRECSFIEKLSWAFRASNGGRQVILIAQMILQKIHRLSLILVGLFSLATNGSLVLMPNGSLSLVTDGRKDRRGPTTTDVFFAISFALYWAIQQIRLKSPIPLDSECQR